MNFLRATFLFALVVLLFTGCFEEPNFGIVPQLTGIEVYFKDMPKLSDSLIVRVEFEDGDGDLGIRGNEDGFFRYELVPNPDTGGPWIYDRSNPDPRLPPIEFQGRLDCRNYQVFDLTPTDTVNKRDTVRASYNEDYYNFSITLYTLEDGQYQEVDLLAECSTPLGGRFPPLKKAEELNNEKPLTGNIRYGITSPTLLSRFRNDTLKIEVTIRDRALHVSNVISLQDFTLRGIEIPVDQ